jgi:hypothetical protein
MAAPIVGENSGGILFARRSFQSASKPTLPLNGYAAPNRPAVFDLIRWARDCFRVLPWTRST